METEMSDGKAAKRPSCILHAQDEDIHGTQVLAHRKGALARRVCSGDN